jgi:chromosome segregation ATPase
MTPNEKPSSPSSDADDFAAALTETERSLAALKERYVQVREDTQRQAELKERLNEVKREQRGQQSPQLKAELKQIQSQLETIELNLESQLFSWGSLKEPFWQAVRFGGLGLLIGWLLKSCAS